MSRTTEAAIRRTGALVALAAASAIELVLFVAVNERRHGVLALYAVSLPGLAAEAAREIFRAAGRAAEALRWVGFTGIVFYAAYVSSNVHKEAAADMVNGFLPFLLFLAEVWTVYLSMIMGRGPPPHRAVAELAWRAEAAARNIFRTAGRAAEEVRWVGFTSIVFYAAYVLSNVHKEAAADMVSGLLLFLLFLAGVWTVYLSMVTGRGPSPHRAVAELARRAAEAARETFRAAGRADEELRWVGFTGVVFYAAYVSSNVHKEAAADIVNSFLLFLLFLAGVWTVCLSMVTGRGPPPAKVLVDKINVFLLFLLFLAGVWTAYLSMITEKDPLPPSTVAAEEDLDLSSMKSEDLPSYLITTARVALSFLRSDNCGGKTAKAFCKNMAVVL